MSGLELPDIEDDYAVAMADTCAELVWFFLLPAMLIVGGLGALEIVAVSPSLASLLQSLLIGVLAGFVVLSYRSFIELLRQNLQ